MKPVRPNRPAKPSRLRIPGRRAWIALLSLLLIGFATYRIGRSAIAGYHYHAALAALERRDFRDASARLDQALAVEPDDLTTRLLAAQTARRRGDYADALAHLRLCEQQGGVAEALALERTLLRVQAGDLAELDRLLAFADAHPEVPETPLMLEACIEGSLKTLAPVAVHGMVRGERAAEAELMRTQRAIDQWLRLRPAPADQSQGLVWRGRAWAAANDHPQALASLRRALEIDPASFPARLYLALFRAEQAPAEAADLLQALHAQAPDDNQVRFALAAVLRNLGKPDEARPLLDAILTAQPENLFALLERGQVALDLEQPRDAEPWLRRALARAPDEPKVNLALASCMQMAGRAAEAKAYQDRYQQLEAERRKRDEAAQKATPAAGVR
jgi:Tfp pilus assembly protein PilF